MAALWELNIHSLLVVLWKNHGAYCESILEHYHSTQILIRDAVIIFQLMETKVSDATWCNISSQGIQPLLEFADSTANSVQVLVDLNEASYSGWENITFKGSLEGDTYFERRIFQGEFILSELPIHLFYSVKSDSHSSLGLVLEFTSTINKKKCLYYLHPRE